MPQSQKKILVLTLLLLPFLWPKIPVISASSEPVTIKPAELSLSTKPKNRLEEVLKISNAGAETVEVSMHTHLVDENVESALKIQKWIEYNPEVTTIAPGQSAFITVSIQIPDEAEPRPYFMTFMADVKPIPAETTPLTHLIPGYDLGTQVTLRIAGKINEQAKIAQFATEPKIKDSLPFNFDIETLNTGNIELNPTGSIKLFNRLTGEVFVVDLSGLISVSPNKSQQITVPFDQAVFWGFYRAELYLVYGMDQIPLSSELTFIYLPLVPLLIYVVLFALVLVTLYWILHHLTRVQRAVWDLTHDTNEKQLKKSGRKGKNAK